MSAVAVLVTGGYFAYQEFGDRLRSKPAAKAASASTTPGSQAGSAAQPPEAGSAVGSAPGSAGSAPGSGSGSGSAEDRPSSHTAVELEVPDLTGLTLEQAGAKLTADGFDEGVLDAPPDFGCTYEDEKRDIVPIGAICNQQRPPGSKVMSNAKVRVVVEHDTYEHGGVEIKNEWHRMPDVVGMSLDRARALLREGGFGDDEFELGEARTSCGRNKVCEQRPKAGARKYANMKGELNLGN